MSTIAEDNLDTNQDQTADVAVEQPNEEASLASDTKAQQEAATAAEQPASAGYTPFDPMGPPKSKEPIPVTKADPKTTTPLPKPEVPKMDWFETRVLNPELEPEGLYRVRGAQGFELTRSAEEYWKSPKIKKAFVDAYGSYAKSEFLNAYKNSAAEFSRFQLGQFQKSQTAYELSRDDLDAARAEVVEHAATLNGAQAFKDTWVNPVRDVREAFNSIKYKKEDGTYVIEKYSPELLEKLRNTKGFSGLAYTEDFFKMDPNTPVKDVYFTAVYDGKIQNSQGKQELVKQSNIVSYWDLDTGPTDFGLFKVNLGKMLANNKLEADSVADYAKILVRAPLNMAVNVMDTGVQVARAVISGTYGVYSLFSDDKRKVDEIEAFKYLTNKGIGLKAQTTSSTTEALKDGFFGSAESALMTVADIALQVALAGGIGKVGAKIGGASATLIRGNLSEVALARAEKRAAEIAVRSTLTSMAVKDTYNDAKENGYSDSEAAMITGAMAIAMWQATSLASYITGDYSDKLLRNNIRESMQNNYRSLMRDMFSGLAEAVEDSTEKQAVTMFNKVQSTVKKVFETTAKLPAKQYMYEARQEALEEMAEELASDIVQHAASAYGTLINNAKEAGKGRFTSVFDDGYFQQAIERYATSGVAGGLGGAIGNIGNRVDLDPLTSTSSLAQIVTSGKKHELISVLKEMKAAGAFGPDTLSTNYNEALQSFDPILAGSGEMSLGEVVYNNFLHDINVVDAFSKKGKFAEATDAVKKAMISQAEDNSISKDYANLMANLLDFHSKTKVSTAIYEDLDALSEAQLAEKVASTEAAILAEQREKIEAIKAKGKEARTSADGSESTTTGSTIADDDEEQSEDVVTRLEKEAAVLGTVSKESILQMLENYRKVRAIANGAASEQYLLNNMVYKNTVFGSMAYRDEKYKLLGKTPLADAFGAMRMRSLKLEQEQAERNLKAEEVNNDVRAITSPTINNLKEVKAIIDRSSIGFLDKESIDHIISLYESSDKLTAFQEAFVEGGPNALLPAGATDQDYINLAMEVMKLDPFLSPADINEGMFYDVDVAKQVIAYIATTPADLALVPSLDGDGMFDLLSMDLVPSIEKYAKQDSPILAALQAVPEDLRAFRSLYQQALAIKDSQAYFKPVTKVEHSINTMFYAGNMKELSKQTLESEGLSQVRELLDSGVDNVYTHSDSKAITAVMNQMEVREALMEIMQQFVPNGSQESLAKVALLREFRLNTLAIIDRKYTDNVLNETSLETHSYKDYTKGSDFFNDFIYDPILYTELVKKDPALYTHEDNEVINKIKKSILVLEAGLVIDPTKDVDDLSNILIYSNRTKVQDFIDDFVASTDILELYKILKDPDRATLTLNIGDGQQGVFLLDGGFRFKFAKAVFKKAKDLIENISKTTTNLPYIEDKNRAGKETFNSFKEILETLPNVAAEVYKEIPEAKATFDRGTDGVPGVEIAKFNMKIENALYKVYSNTGKFLIPPADHAIIKNEIMDHLKNKANGLASYYVDKNSKPYRLMHEMVLAFTTDLTPFYSKMKDYLSTMKEDDKLLIASQEAAAKAAAAMIYSSEFKEVSMALKDSSRRTSAMHALFIGGTAGAGKSSTTAEFGIKLGMEISKELGRTNTAAWALAPNIHQVGVIESSLGPLTEGVAGRDFQSAFELLKAAVVNNDAAALSEIASLGVIVIDEVTYINSRKDLEPFLRLVTKYEAMRGVDSLPVILMGDIKQTSIVNEDWFNQSVDPFNTVTTGYLGFSFRGRNNLLVSSIQAIQDAYDISTSVYGGASSSVKNLNIKKGLQYGVTGGRLYGVNITKAEDPTTNKAFLDLANNDELISNIERNIAENQAQNAGLPAGAKEIPFTVLVSPEDTVSFMNEGTKLKALMEDPKTAKHFKLVAAKDVGGLEANYILAELHTKTTSVSQGYVKHVGKSLNTMVTRAFDFAHIIDRTDIITIGMDAKPEKVRDDSVVIPSSRMDASAKKALTDFYLEIFQDIPSGVVASPTVPTTQVPTDKDELDALEVLIEAARQSINLFSIDDLSKVETDMVNRLVNTFSVTSGAGIPRYFNKTQDERDAMLDELALLASDLSGTPDTKPVGDYVELIKSALMQIDKTFSVSSFPSVVAVATNHKMLHHMIEEAAALFENESIKRSAPSGSQAGPTPPSTTPPGYSSNNFTSREDVAKALGVKNTLRLEDYTAYVRSAEAYKDAYNLDGTPTNGVYDPAKTYIVLNEDGTPKAEVTAVSTNASGITYAVLNDSPVVDINALFDIKAHITKEKKAAEELATKYISFMHYSAFVGDSNDFSETTKNLYKTWQEVGFVDDADSLSKKQINNVYDLVTLSKTHQSLKDLYMETPAGWLDIDGYNTGRGSAVVGSVLRKLGDIDNSMSLDELSTLTKGVALILFPNKDNRVSEAVKIYDDIANIIVQHVEADREAERQADDAAHALALAKKDALMAKIENEKSLSILYAINNYLKGVSSSVPAEYATLFTSITDPDHIEDLKISIEQLMFKKALTVEEKEAFNTLKTTLLSVGINAGTVGTKAELDVVLTSPEAESVLAELDSDMLSLITDLYNKAVKYMSPNQGPAGSGVPPASDPLYNVVKGFLIRRNQREQFLEDYQASIESLNAGFTVGVTDYNKNKFGAVLSSMDIKIVEDRDLASWMTETSKLPDFPETTLELLVRKDSPTKADILVVASVPDSLTGMAVKTVVGQLQNNAKNSDITEKLIAKAVMYTSDIQDGEVALVKTGLFIGDAISLRPGAIKPLPPSKDGLPNRLAEYTDLAEVSDKITLSNDVFIQTGKSSDVVQDVDILDMKGESFVVYSAKSSSSIDSGEILNVFNSGNNAAQKLPSTSERGLKKNIGLVRVVLRPPLIELGKYLKERDADPSLGGALTTGSFTSLLSLSIQNSFLSQYKSMVDSIKASSSQDYVSVEYAPGKFDKIPAEAFVTQYDQIANDYEAFFLNKTEENKKRILAELARITNGLSPQLKASLNEFGIEMGKLVVNKFRTGADKFLAGQLLTFRRTKKGSILSFDNILRNGDERVLQALDNLMTAYNTPLKFSKKAGGVTQNISILDPHLVETFKKYLKVPIRGISDPTFTITDTGVTMISQALSGKATVLSPTQVQQKPKQQKKPSTPTVNTASILSKDPKEWLDSDIEAFFPKELPLGEVSADIPSSLLVNKEAVERLSTYFNRAENLNIDTYDSYREVLKSLDLDEYIRKYDGAKMLAELTGLVDEELTQLTEKLIPFDIDSLGPFYDLYESLLAKNEKGTLQEYLEVLKICKIN